MYEIGRLWENHTFSCFCSGNNDYNPGRKTKKQSVCSFCMNKFGKSLYLVTCPLGECHTSCHQLGDLKTEAFLSLFFIYDFHPLFLAGHFKFRHIFMPSLKDGLFKIYTLTSFSKSPLRLPRISLRWISSSVLDHQHLLVW